MQIRRQCDIWILEPNLLNQMYVQGESEKSNYFRLFLQGGPKNGPFLNVDNFAMAIVVERHVICQKFANFV